MGVQGEGTTTRCRPLLFWNALASHAGGQSHRGSGRRRGRFERRSSHYITSWWAQAD